MTIALENHTARHRKRQRTAALQNLTEMALVLCLLLTCSHLFGASAQSTTTLSDATLTTISFEQKLGASIPLDLTFTDETGASVALSHYFNQKPVILVLGYYGCPMLCSMVLNGMVESLEDLKWSIGQEFTVINVSIDPSEKPELAAAKKRAYLKRYGRAGAADGWHFLTGHAAQIQKLTRTVGFQYVYDPGSKQFAHPSGFVIVAPNGTVSRYLFGVTFAPQEVFSGLQTAAAQKVGSPIQQLLLLCFHYNPIAGRYGMQIMIAVRALSAATLVGLSVGFIMLVRREPKFWGSP